MRLKLPLLPGLKENFTKEIMVWVRRQSVRKIEIIFKNLRKPIPVRGPVCVFLNVDKNPRVSVIFLGKIKVKLGQRFGL